FGHFENLHPAFITALNTFRPAPFSSPVMQTYSYAPQKKVNTIDTINETAGNTVTLTTIVSGAQNHYVWFKDGVAIPGAPDSPTYTINSLNPCDSGVYYSEIRSDLVPFENASPPGTGGRNLLLVRNDITLNVAGVTNVCPTLITPTSGATNVPLNQPITWTDNPNACTYSISIGTTAGGTQILNNFNVGDVNTYLLTANLPANTTIFIRVITNLQSGTAPACPEQSFTTGTTILNATPDCAILTLPLNNATNVAVNSNISWAAAARATGYRLSIGTTPGGTNVLNNQDLGNVLSYNPPADFLSNTIYYVTVIPYNGVGDATGCTEESFTTVVLQSVPPCTNLVSPVNNEIDVLINTSISWNTALTATGYFLSIGTTPGGTNILNNLDLGNTTVYNPPANLLNNTVYYVTVIPYNSTGSATGCNEESFRTRIAIPSCTMLTSPLNNAVNVPLTTNFTWSAAAGATNYRISIGTTPGGTDIVNDQIFGNVLTANLAGVLINGTTYYVTITPFNAAGNATGCIEESFTTITAAPDCTTITSPLDGEVNIAINTNISWAAATGATGYRLSIGTTPGGTNVLNNQDLGNVISYNPTANLLNDQIYFVTITPYNVAGNATGCTESSFTTQIAIPACTALTTPANGTTGIAINTSLSWTAAARATGYRISIGTTTGGTNVLNNQDIGSVLTYTPATNLLNNQTYFVTITPYNATGSGTGCTESSFTTQIAIPACTALTTPTNGATAVAINTNLSWAAAARATGYRLSIGTTPGGTSVLNNQDLGNVLTYNPPADLLNESTYYVTLIPYNAGGNATACVESTFTTIVAVPECTTLTTPAGSAANVVINTTLSWPVAARATGYRLSIGTSPGAVNILNNQDLGNVLTYSPPVNFLNGTTYYATVTAYNLAGNATGCSESTFTTIVTIPACTTLNSPANGAVDVEITANLGWTRVAGAAGYILTMGTVPGGTDLLDNVDVGNSSRYNALADFEYGTTYYVTVTPYNVAGTSIACSETFFTTLTAVMVIPAYFTPNQDGYHDVWIIEDLNNEIARVTIFDRYGKLLVNTSSNIAWDGTFNGQPLPSSDYWYAITTTSGRVIKGHFSLVR
ncbi:MAG: T9SS type B sorting domain-containing protein, partial [Nonlabens sp.]|nr:T9SS type B sorting domain-containing protein [Nonlabens sp.]